VGPDPIFRKKLTVDRLVGAINHAVTQAEMRERAHALGAEIRAEDGVAIAAAITEQLERSA
jgi:UDP:flavonoid glycosyltransferase YjiC (YdhE family)